MLFYEKNGISFSIDGLGKKREIILIEVYFWNIPDIFHIPKNMKLCLLRYFFGIFRNIPYSKKFEIMLVEVYFWNIPGISHIAENLKITMFNFFLEYSICQISYSIEY